VSRDGVIEGPVVAAIAAAACPVSRDGMIVGKVIGSAETSGAAESLRLFISQIIRTLDHVNTI